jgi:hypothetical protein
MLKFRDTFEDLQNIVQGCAILGEWSFHKFTGSRPRPTPSSIGGQAQARSISRGTTPSSSRDSSLDLAWSVKSPLGKLCLVPHRPWTDREKPQVLPGQETAGGLLLHPRRVSFPGQPSFSPLLVAVEELEDHGKLLLATAEASERSSSRYRFPPADRAAARRFTTKSCAERGTMVA